MSIYVYVIYVLVLVYTWLIVARALLTWFRPRPGSPAFPVYRALFRITEPYLGLFRRLLPIARLRNVGIDLSYMLGLIVLFIVIQLLARI